MITIVKISQNARLQPLYRRYLHIRREMTLKCLTQLPLASYCCVLALPYRILRSVCLLTEFRTIVSKVIDKLICCFQDFHRLYRFCYNMFHHILALLLMLSVTSKAANDYDYTLEGAIAEMNSQPLKRLPPIFLDGNPEAGNGIYIEIPNMSPFRFCIEDSVGNVADHTGVDYSIIGLRSKAALNSLKIKPSNGVILPGPDQNLDGWWYIRRGRHSKPERLLRVGYRGDHGWRLIVEAAIRSSKAKFGRLSDLRDGMIIVQRAGIRSWSREFVSQLFHAASTYVSRQRTKLIKKYFQWTMGHLK